MMSRSKVESSTRPVSSQPAQRAQPSKGNSTKWKSQLIERFTKQNTPETFNTNFLNNALEVYEQTQDRKVRDMIVDNLMEMDTREKYVMSYKQNNRQHNIMLNANTISTIIRKIDNDSTRQIRKYGSDQLDDFDIDEIKDFKITKYIRQRNNDGAFFPYQNDTPFDLTRYQIYRKTDKRDDEHCIMYALRNTNQFSNDELQQICSKLISKSFPRNKLTEIAEILKCKINLAIYHNGAIKTSNYGKSDKIVYLGLYEDHYFANETCPIHLYAVRNRDKYETDPKLNEIKQLGGSGKPYYTNKFEKKTIHIIKEIKETNGFSQLLYSDYKENIDYQNLNEKYKSFNLLQEDCEFIPVKVRGEFETKSIYFADFEATTNGKFHEAFTISWMHIDDKEVKNATGPDCAKQFLNAIPDNSKVYFHNLKYDLQYIFKHCVITGDCEKEGQIYSTDISFFKKNIQLVDSYKMISTKLQHFEKTFKLDCKKEMMPYDFYTTSRVLKPYSSIKDIEKFYLQNGGKDEWEKFSEIAKDYFIGKRFMHMDYSVFYCNQDVRVLRDGFITFRKWCLEGLNMDIVNYLSSASLADQYFIKEGCYDEVSQLKGSIRAFVQEAVVGGRVMSKDNKKWHLKEKIQDFDGVSLYPSAMSRIDGFPKGAPKIGINTNADFYVVEIKLKSIKETMDCPTYSVKNKAGTRVWDHSIPEDTMIVDKYTLEDMITFHGAKFEIIRGVYWDEGFNTKMCEKIREVFQLRLKYKQEKNDIQEVFKLIMNSAYGKTILKSSNEKNIWICGQEKLESYINKNFNMIKSYEEYPNQDPKYSSYKLKLYVSMNEHKNRAHCGAMILSMSKRIMNEVVYAAKLSDCPIYYSDTDSTHIPDSKVHPLADKYREIYGRELIGKQLGQFHCDFANDCHAVETVIIDKKIYCDRLSDGTFHFRCKGVSGKSIEYEAKQNYGGDIAALYASKNKIEFDLLCDNQVKFEFINGQGVRSNKRFTREIQF